MAHKGLKRSSGWNFGLVEVCRHLGRQLTESWCHHGDRPEIPSDQDDETFARRLIVRRCLYGVDRNPIAVDLAKLSLWLATLAKDQPLSFVDHALRAGDSLVGLSQKQIDRFHWFADGEPIQQRFEAEIVSNQVRKVTEFRRRIQTAEPDTPDRRLRDWEREARDAAANVTLYGDLALSAFFHSTRPAARSRRLRELALLVLNDTAAELRPSLEEQRTHDPPFAPFHWEVEFPEVFGRQNPGFDAIVSNPPFLGGKRISTVLGSQYRDWLATRHRSRTSNADLAAHFLRQAFSLLRDQGHFGLIATSEITTGDTRVHGLQTICESGGTIYDARTRLSWPGPATVFVSVAHVRKGAFPLRRHLNGRPVDRITAFLFHSGSDRGPVSLDSNRGKSFVGSFLHGMGFTFDDFARSDAATPLSTMRHLFRSDERNRNVVHPTIGGLELNTSPTHAHHRYAIDFQDWPLRRDDIGRLWSRADDRERNHMRRQTVVPLDYPDPVAEDWPDILEIVKHKVRPERLRQRRKSHSDRWWRYGDHRTHLYAATHGLSRVLAIASVSSHTAFAFLPTEMIYQHSLIIFALETYATYCVLQSRLHEIWARFFGSSRGDYHPSTCFDTFPLPEKWQTRTNLETAGHQYDAWRAKYMSARREGLTKTYNRFHAPDEHDPAIHRLRELHEAMDSAVLAAYGWNDIPTKCEFLVDHDDRGNQVPLSGAGKRWRYRWPDEVHDEVLARLLALNTERAAEERTPQSANERHR